MASLFDAYIAVDWSARSRPSPARPSPDSIWVAERVGAVSQDWYWRTRWACRDFLEERLASHVDIGRRVLVGFDFSYGYPSGFADAIGLSGEAPVWQLVWRELQRLIVDAPDNANNRFGVAAELNGRCGDGPFWGCPPAQQRSTLRSTRPRNDFVTRRRWADQRASGLQSAWQLLGRGSVGSQSLLGIPIVARLRFDSPVSDVSRVWPFETGFTTAMVPAQDPFVLHAEIWPGLAPQPLDASLVKDQAQVRAVTDWLAELDGAGRLARLFDRPADLPEAGLIAAVHDEGWILGA